MVVVTEASGELKSMTERELKSNIESLKRQLNSLNTEIRKSIDEIKLHRGTVTKLREKRDELNAYVKECVKKAHVCRKDRDEANQKITDLKKLRKDAQDQINQKWEQLNQVKDKRDQSNAIAKMRTTSLEKAYAHELYVFTHADIPLKHEIGAYERLKDLSKRLNASREADKIHTELVPMYKQVKELRNTADAVHQSIQSLADESQQHHDELLGIYADLDTVRKEANQYHARLKDEYRIIDPISKSIDVHKASVPRLREELSAHIDALKDRQKVDGAEECKVAVEKLKTTGRMSLEDLRVLMDNNAISFD